MHHDFAQWIIGSPLRFCLPMNTMKTKELQKIDFIISQIGSHEMYGRERGEILFRYKMLIKGPGVKSHR